MTTAVTVSQALRRIKKLKGQMAEHLANAKASHTWIVGKSPAYEFQQELDAFKVAREEMVELESRVAVANATNTVAFKDRQVTLAEVIRHLQEIKGEITFYKSLHPRFDTDKERDYVLDDNTGKSAYVTTLVTWTAVLTEKERNEKVAQLQDLFEELNNLLEAANHRVNI